MKKFYVRDRLLKNSLLTCVAALTVGAGFIINTQNVKAADTNNDSTEASQSSNSTTGTTSSAATSTPTVISDKPAAPAVNSDTTEEPEETQQKSAPTTNVAQANVPAQTNVETVSDASISTLQATPVARADGNNQVTSK